VNNVASSLASLTAGQRRSLRYAPPICEGKPCRKRFFAFAFAVCPFANTRGAKAQNYPTPKESDWVARDFRFHTGEVLPELRIHYTTVGAPSAEPVLILHGTTQSGTAP
jgi:hypothetical protein